jgi:Rhomboid-like protein
MDRRAAALGRLAGRAHAAARRCWAARRQYAVAWIFLGVFLLAGVLSAALPGHERSALLWWASTDRANLRHHPAGALIVSAFFPDGGGTLAWVPLIALALFGANRALGNARTAVVITAGHVLGTLVSEGILDDQIAHRLRPAAEAQILDIGPSYVVVSTIAAALLLGTHPARLAAGADLAFLVLAGNIFGGLSTLQVAAVGHVTAIAVAAPLAAALGRTRPRRAPAAAGPGPERAAGAGPGRDVMPADHYDHRGG